MDTNSEKSANTYFTTTKRSTQDTFSTCIKMASTDFNMLRLEAPRNVLQITDGTEQAEETLEVANPATWLRALAKQQKQAEQDLAQLVHLWGNTVDHADQRIQQIEQAY